MRTNASYKWQAPILVSALICAACHPRFQPALNGNERRDVSIVVLAYMVPRAAADPTVTRFVSLAEPDISKLREMCGTKYQIQPADAHTQEADVPDGAKRPGVHLSVSITSVNPDRAEAAAAYSSSGSFASFRYTLSRSGGTWRVTSSRFVVAS